MSLIPADPFLDLRGLPLKGGERMDRLVHIEIAPLVLGGLRYEVVVRNGTAVVTVERVSGGFLVTLRLTSTVYGSCFRCLREVALDIEPEQQEFVPTHPEEWEDTDISPFISDFVVDVNALAREAVVLSLPDKVLCEEGCRGLCPSCGSDREQNECECEPVGADPRWEKLKLLQLDDREHGTGG